MLEIADQKLDHVKKAVIDAVIRDPDLDVAALNYHLQVGSWQCIRGFDGG